MRAIKKKTNPRVYLEAVAAVSGYDINTLLGSQKHSITPWAAIGMFVAREAGLTYAEIGELFQRTTGHCHRQCKKMEYPVNRGINEKVINEIIERKNSLIEQDELIEK